MGSLQADIHLQCVEEGVVDVGYLPFLAILNTKWMLNVVIFCLGIL